MFNLLLQKHFYGFFISYVIFWSGKLINFTLFFFPHAVRMVLKVKIVIVSPRISLLHFKYQETFSKVLTEMWWRYKLMCNLWLYVFIFIPNFFSVFLFLTKWCTSLYLFFRNVSWIDCIRWDTLVFVAISRNTRETTY